MIVFFGLAEDQARLIMWAPSGMLGGCLWGSSLSSEGGLGIVVCGWALWSLPLTFFFGQGEAGLGLCDISSL